MKILNPVKFIQDERGYFYRNFTNEYFPIVHINRSFNHKKGTIRGFHFQIPPKEEDKVIQALKGSFFDIVVDLRYYPAIKWQGFEITAESRQMLWIPKGFAHGIQTLTDDCEIQYFTSEVYSPEHERGIRWNDPEFDFKWPLEPTIISDKDKNWPDFKQTWSEYISFQNAKGDYEPIYISKR